MSLLHIALQARSKIGQTERGFNNIFPFLLLTDVTLTPNTLSQKGRGARGDGLKNFHLTSVIKPVEKQKYRNSIFIQSFKIITKPVTANPYHSWERRLNEHTNGLTREFYPKSTNFPLAKLHQNPLHLSLNWRSTLRRSRCLSVKQKSRLNWRLIGSDCKRFLAKPSTGFEPVTFPLPRECSTTEP